MSAMNGWGRRSRTTRIQIDDVGAAHAYWSLFRRHWWFGRVLGRNPGRLHGYATFSDSISGSMGLLGTERRRESSWIGSTVSEAVRRCLPGLKKNVLFVGLLMFGAQPAG